jgi:lysophospholipase L1-like esterase
VGIAWNAGQNIQNPYQIFTGWLNADLTPNEDAHIEVQGVTKYALYTGIYYIATQPYVALPTYRFMTDAAQVDMAFDGAAANLPMEVFVDGQPIANPNLLFTANAGWFTLQFVSSKPRLIEVRTAAPFAELLIGPHDSIWRPQPVQKPRMLVVGDSYVGGSGVSTLNQGIYQSIGDLLGIEDVWIDGYGGTGYIARSTIPAGSPGNYVERLPWHILVNPDILVIHGGGGNDVGVVSASGGTVSTQTDQIRDAVLDYFTQAKDALPNAKLVYVEPFVPPLWRDFGYQVYFDDLNPKVRAALEPLGVYIIDVYTSGQWLTGTGFLARDLTVTTTSGSAVVTGQFDIPPLENGARITGAGIPAGATISSVAADSLSATMSVAATASGTITAHLDTTQNDGNSDKYVSTDGVHPGDVGATYIRNRLTPALLSILEHQP